MPLQQKRLDALRSLQFLESPASVGPSKPRNISPLRQGMPLFEDGQIGEYYIVMGSVKTNGSGKTVKLYMPSSPPFNPAWTIPNARIGGAREEPKVRQWTQWYGRSIGGEGG